MVFEQLAHADAYHCSLVCRRWSSIAISALWRPVSFRIHPKNNSLAVALRENKRLFKYLVFTQFIILDLGSLHPSPFEPITSYFKLCRQNFQLQNRIITRLPLLMTEMEIKFDCTTCQRGLDRHFRKAINAPSRRSTEEVYIDCTQFFDRSSEIITAFFNGPNTPISRDWVK